MKVSTTPDGKVLDLFFITDTYMVQLQKSLSLRLKMELLCPLKVAIASQGPDTEFLALKMLGLCIFSAEV
ncbi:hypothetical protein MTR_7g102350 [Medicago truncatula]|uniref:Uncharacterized protein n=1 Tax=Medicago truncatula TaxID=3880 RepID=G7L3Y2_MEDTR|nr:hypothetical protein MTR_7g102350 [Medicago truncatula]